MAEFDQSSDVYKRGCRHFRLEQFKTEPGVNAEYTFDLKNFELYGTIIGACKKDLDHLSAMQRLTQTISRERRTGERFTLRIPRHLTSTIRGLHQNAVEQQLRALEAVTLELSSHNSALSRSNSREVGNIALQELLFTCNRRAMYLQSALSTESSTNPHTPLDSSASPSQELETTQDNEVEVNNIADVTNEQHPTSNKALTFLTDDELLRQSSMTNSGENQSQDLQNTSDQHQTTSLDANELFNDLELRRSDVMRMILNEGEESILDSDVEMDDELDIRDAVDSYADEVDTQNDDEQDCDDEGNTSDDYEDNQCDDDSLGEVDDEEQEEEEDNDELFAEIDAHELHEFSNSLGGINVMIERKSRALLPAYDPRPGQNNVSSTQDIDMDTITKFNKEHKDHRRQKKLDDNQQLLIKLELNSQHPDVQKLKIPTLHQTLKRKSKKCLYWYMRKILSRLDTKERNEISKHTWEKLFRLKLELIDLQQSRDSCNSECDEDYDDDTLRFSKEKMQILSGDYTKIIKQLFAMLSKPDCKFDLSYFHYSRLIALIDKLLLDPLTVASGTHPSWIDEILKQMPFLVSFNTRLRYFRALSFGTTRSLIWILQDSDFIREFNVARFIGRLKKERCTLRRNYLLRDACELLEYHSLHKSELELVWKDEDGTGLGPTMEFYTLLTAELLRKDLGLWLVDENSSSNTHVNNPFGLFPAPYPRDHWKLIEVCRLFHLLGILIAKCLQDNRQCSELNLSDPLLKLLCPPVQMRSVPINKRISLSLDYEDFCKIQPERARIFKHLAGKNLDDMCLTFNYAPSNQFYGYTECRLGSHKSFDPVTASNLKEYIKEITNFVLRDGVAMQIKALLCKCRKNF
ncbi:hypothetical protein GJ496_003257 [Pomphorhynchus laevis]|nr:hypothetical protein GJ496_003257 [Pomphorhynchus laevis]